MMATHYFDLGFAGMTDVPFQNLTPKKGRSLTVKSRHVGLSDLEKAAISVACQRFIDKVLKPRFLPTIRPTQFNYPIDILGKWHGNRRLRRSLGPTIPPKTSLAALFTGCASSLFTASALVVASARASSAAISEKMATPLPEAEIT
jgi:hypothetical protein